MSEFYVGQKVVCVNADNLSIFDPLQKGKVYTVRALDQCPSCGYASVFLCEIAEPEPIQRAVCVVCSSACMMGERPYRAYRFRPLDERKTDISIFTARLDKTPQGVDA